MSTVAAQAHRKSIKNVKAQLYFGFFEPCSVSNGARQAIQKKLQPSKRPQPKPEERSDFSDLCLLLHGLAQKHVSRADFEDFTALIRCTKLLVDLGLPVTPSAAIAAPVANQDAALVLRDPKYRLLRNRAIACLATVADLVTKAPAKGSLEYQQGMRDAFQQASDVAVMFLEDIQNGV